jgi:hypothetical protein
MRMGSPVSGSEKKSRSRLEMYRPEKQAYLEGKEGVGS